MTHTSGGWNRNIKPAKKYPVVFAGRNKHVAIVCTQGLPDTEIEANCNLITAAPDMLAALKEIIRFVDSKGSEHINRVPFVAARTAIAKAERE